MGCVSCFELNETSGTTAYDSMGYHNANISGNTLLNQTGIIGKSFYFDGTDTKTQLITGYPFSISFWINMSLHPTLIVMVMKVLIYK